MPPSSAPASHPTPRALPSSREADNAVRLVPGSSRGHVESHFLKANAPDGLRALWLKHTLLVPQGAPERAVAEVWAVSFERSRVRGLTRRRGHKRSFPRDEASWTHAPFRWRAPCAELGDGFARGELEGPTGPGMRWDLRFTSAAPAFRPFPSARMYEGAFPRSKSLTPYPDAAFEGSFEVAGERWNVEGFVGSQGHNWGRSHAHAYAWVHGNHWRAEDGSDASVWLEALTGRVRVGPLLTPWLSTAAISIDGVLHRFDGPRALLGGRLRVDQRSLAFAFQQGEESLRGRVWASTDELAGLRYEDPDARTLACLNSKLASGEVILTARGRTCCFKSHQVALELGTRRADHGVTMLL